MAKRSRTRKSVPEETPPNMPSPALSLTPYADDWVANTTTESTAHTSTANLSPVVGNDMSPIRHGLPDVSHGAHSEAKSPPKACEGTSDYEVMMDDDEGSSRRLYMPFDNDLCDLRDHDSDVEAPSGARGERVEPEVHSGPSRKAKRARVNLTIKDAERSLSNESIGKFLAHTCDCGHDFTSVITRSDTLRWRTATHDFCQHGRVSDHALNLLNAVDIANPNTRKDLKTNSKVFVHKSDDLTVCEEVF